MKREEGNSCHDMATYKTDKFFQLVRYAICEDSPAPRMDAADWEAMYEMSKKQSVVGVVFDAIVVPSSLLMYTVCAPISIELKVALPDVSVFAVFTVECISTM